MTWHEVFETQQRFILSSTELISFGATSHSLTAAVRGGHLIRARRDHYALPGTGQQILAAVRVGGRVGCVSALNTAGVFAYDTSDTHVHMEESMSRLRSPRNRLVSLTPHNRGGCNLHWWPLFDEDHSCEYAVGIPDALAQSLRCQKPWHALASLDNALFLGRIETGDLQQIFASIPSRLHYLMPLVDGCAEAGQESVLRMIVREAGLSCELQVWIPGVGRVDMLVEGCLVVEADSRLAHDGWERHVEDRHRDLVLASQGYMSLRPAYQHTMHSPGLVRDAVVNLVAARHRFRSHV
jgi:very-short-patch-repair endonuclease